MDYGFSDKRRKGKDKRKDKKRHPYRKGGGHRILGKNIVKMKDFKG